MNKEEFEAHCAELDRQAVAGKWKNAFEALVCCYLATKYKRKWKHYDREFDYEQYAEDLIGSMGMIKEYYDVDGHWVQLEHMYGPKYGVESDE